VRISSSTAAVATELSRGPSGSGIHRSPGSSVIRQRIQVEYRYEVYFTRDVFTSENPVLADALGYAAATTHRGVRMVRMPTTVLAQNDSGVGVKNAINAFSKKNFLGTFAPPFAVINDAAFLPSLPHREKVAGMAEAVKVALIRDPAFFEWLARNTRGLARAEAEPLRRAHGDAAASDRGGLRGAPDG
jgi:hypothetical protein